MNPQEKENRAENREEKNREEHRKEKTDKPARLGREAKIGATVILLLLVTFVAVVVVRLTHSDGKTLASTAEADTGKHRPPSASNDDPLFRDVNSKSFGNRQPTVVPASAASTKPLGGLDGGLGKWNLPSDKSEPKRVENRYSSPSLPPSSPPSFASDPPKPPHANRYDPVASDPLPGLDADKPSRFDKKSHDESRLDPPDVKKRAVHADPVGSVTTRKDFERGNSSGFASAGDPPASPQNRVASRYEDHSAALLPPSPPRDNAPYDRGAGRSYSAAPASQYDDDFPRESTKPAHDYERPHRYDSPSYGSLPPRRDDGKYEIQPNDSYWTISEKVYGTGGYFKALAEQNRGKVGNEDRLTPGDLISTPSVAQLEKSYPELCPKASRRETQESRTMNVSTRQSYRGGRTYTVSEGDTLFNIARYELGKASRWAEIYELNRDVLGKDFNYLTPGMKLVLPDGEKADVLTRKSGDLLR
jgi:nucleoid-associated protein YgaU